MNGWSRNQEPQLRLTLLCTRFFFRSAPYLIVAGQEGGSGAALQHFGSGTCLARLGRQTDFSTSSTSSAPPKILHPSSIAVNLAAVESESLLVFISCAKMADKDTADDKDALDALELEAKEFDKASLRLRR